jgi:hypothetical protein
MFAILRGANGRRHEVDFGDDAVTIDVAMSATTVQVTMQGHSVLAGLKTDEGTVARRIR